MKAVKVITAVLFFITLPGIVCASQLSNANHPSVNPPIINLNKANVSELSQSVKGIGKKRAQAIVAYRKSHGEFHSVAELAQVKGLGNAFVEHHLAELQRVFVVK